MSPQGQKLAIFVEELCLHNIGFTRTTQRINATVISFILSMISETIQMIWRAAVGHENCLPSGQTW